MKWTFLKSRLGFPLSLQLLLYTKASFVFGFVGQFPVFFCPPFYLFFFWSLLRFIHSRRFVLLKPLSIYDETTFFWGFTLIFQSSKKKKCFGTKNQIFLCCSGNVRFFAVDRFFFQIFCLVHHSFLISPFMCIIAFSSRSDNFLNSFLFIYVIFFFFFRQRSIFATRHEISIWIKCSLSIHDKMKCSTGLHATLWRIPFTASTLPFWLTGACYFSQLGIFVICCFTLLVFATTKKNHHD
jgi:hypothetical protein